MSDGFETKAFRIGNWLVEPDLNLVSDGERAVTLEPRVMKVLQCLAKQPGQIISPEKLLEDVWAGRAHADNTVYQAIGQLRKALDDNIHRPRYIETIPKRGYRLIENVRPAGGTGSELISADSGSTTRQSEQKLRFAIVTFLALALAFLVYDEVFNEQTYSVGATAESVQATPISAPGGSEISIVVLPFDNMSDEPENEYFSDGISEEIRILIARIPSLKVIGRESSSAFKGKSVSPNAVGQKLAVDMVLEGSVRRSGDRVRISALLVNVADGTQIWSETYVRTMTDIFAIQDDIAAAIFDALQIQLGAVPARGRPTENTEAYILFLKAKVSISTFDIQDAEGFLRQAIDLDPEFAEAYELLAFAYWALTMDWVLAEDGQELMSEAAAKALAINPDLDFARALYEEAANIEKHTFVKELAAFENVLRKQPNNPDAMDALSFALLEYGYFRESLNIAQRYVELDPLSLAANWRLCDALFAVGQTSEAMSVWKVIDQLDPRGEDWLIAVRNLIDKQDEAAIESFEAFLQRHDYQYPDFPDSSWVSDLVAGARDPTTGQMYLDRKIPQILDSVPTEYVYGWQQMLSEFYLYFGYLDRYFDLILASDLTAPGRKDAAALVWVGTRHRQLGFTAHPKYLEVAESLGIIEVWEQRGAPDFCEKTDNGWACE